MTEKDRGREKRPNDDWPEPPGYLGEAVRRAKLIPRRDNRAEPPPVAKD
jgi:hypothetical protein